MVSTDPAPVTHRRSWVIAGVVLLALGGLLSWAIWDRGGEPFAIDAWWNEAVKVTGGPVHAIAHALNVTGGHVFGTWILPAAIPLVLLIIRRPWGAATFLAASLVSVGLIQLIKNLVARARPPEQLVDSDFGSFPSGHTANAATMVIILVILFPRIWVMIAAAVWAIAMALSRTVLHAHWLSDTVGGMTLGAAAAFLVAAAFAVPLARERHKITHDRGSARSIG